MNGANWLNLRLGSNNFNYACQNRFKSTFKIVLFANEIGFSKY